MTDPLMPSTGRLLTVADLAIVEEIFSLAADAPAPDRAAIVAARAVGPDIHDEVIELLAAHDRAESFLPSANNTVTDVVTPSLSSSMVGHYRLLEKIGEGGMGDVYRAERADGLFEHAVAIKVVRTSLPDGDLLRRFLAERQILASMQHPNIVTLLDAGATSAGQPYIVMERVDGAPLNTYCRDRGLSLDARLRLLVQVCRAVQYAHQRAIVHRDLKPANILVTRDGVPKVLDFGIAKLLESSSSEAATKTGLLPGPLTPNYASPEQLRGLSVTTACDVYALGILLYEVAAGARPYDTTGQALDHVLEMVLRTDVVRPSDAATVENRAAAWRGRLKGDLDAITLKAIAKEPDARYGSAGELADDLERFLEGKPVVAQEPSAAYIVRRLAARNKTTMSIAVISLVLIVTALGVAIWQRHQAVLARSRAEQRYKEVRQLAHSLIFKIHDAVAPLPGSTPVRQTIVNEALAYLETLGDGSHDDDSLRIELSDAYRQIGRILGDPQTPNLGNRPGAIVQFERARSLVLPLASRPAGSSDAEVALINVDRLLCSVLRAQGDRARATEFAREAVTYSERRVQRDPADRLARDLQAKAAFDAALTVAQQDAAPYWRRAGALFDALLAEKPDDPERQRNAALVEKYWGSLLDSRGQHEEADAHYSRARSLDEQRYARSPSDRRVQFDLAIDLGNAAMIAEKSGRYDEAYSLYVRSLEMRQALSASDPQDVQAKGRVGYVHTRLAWVEFKRGQSVSALTHADEAVRIQKSVAAVTNDQTTRREFGEALVTQARAQEALGRHAAACAGLREAVKVFQALPPAVRDQTHFDENAVAKVASCGAGASQ